MHTITERTRIIPALVGALFMVSMGGIADAADTPSPFAGTWHMNAAHSKVGTGADEIKTYDAVISEAGDGKLRSQTSWTMADGTKGTRDWTAKANGEKTPVSGDPDVDSIMVTSKDPHSTTMRLSKAGKVIEWGNYTVSADGKTLRATEGTGAGKDAKTLYHLVFDRQ